MRLVAHKVSKSTSPFKYDLLKKTQPAKESPSRNINTGSLFSIEK